MNTMSGLPYLIYSQLKIFKARLSGSKLNKTTSILFLT